MAHRADMRGWLASLLLAAMLVAVVLPACLAGLCDMNASMPGGMHDMGSSLAACPLLGGAAAGDALVGATAASLLLAVAALFAVTGILLLAASTFAGRLMLALADPSPPPDLLGVQLRL